MELDTVELIDSPTSTQHASEEFSLFFIIRDSPNFVADLNLLAESIAHVPVPISHHRFIPITSGMPFPYDEGVRNSMDGSRIQLHMNYSQHHHYPITNYTNVHHRLLHQKETFVVDRKKAHIVSEQKRRQHINEGFEELRKLIPTCSTGSDSKAAILRKGLS